MGKCERFFLAVGKHKHFKLNVEVMAYMMSFAENMAEVMANVKCISNACDCVIKSTALGGILKKILAVGNLVNEGAGRPKVAGITIDSLMKTAQTKGVDKVTTVLDYVVKMVNERTPSDEKNVIEVLSVELAGLIDGSRVNANEVRKAGKAIKEGVDMIENAMSKMGSEFGRKCEEFLIKIESKMENMSISMSQLESKIKSLCVYFAEDDEKIEASSIMKILIQFNSALSKSNEVWKRKEKSRRRQDAARANSTQPQQPEPKKKVNSSSQHNLTFVATPKKGFGGISKDDRREGAEEFFSAADRPSTAPPKVTPNKATVSGMNFNQDLLKSAMMQRRKSLIGGIPEEDRKGSFGLDDIEDDDGSGSGDEDWNDAK